MILKRGSMINSKRAQIWSLTNLALNLKPATSQLCGWASGISVQAEAVAE